MAIPLHGHPPHRMACDAYWGVVFDRRHPLCFSVDA